MKKKNISPFYKTPEEAVEAAIASGWVDDFDGNNCSEVEDEMGTVCNGWDGVSRRCECGNRRVNWEIGGDEETGYFAYACAY